MYKYLKFKISFVLGEEKASTTLRNTPGKKEEFFYSKRRRTGHGWSVHTKITTLQQKMYYLDCLVWTTKLSWIHTLLALFEVQVAGWLTVPAAPVIYSSTGKKTPFVCLWTTSLGFGSAGTCRRRFLLTKNKRNFEFQILVNMGNLSVSQQKILGFDPFLNARRPRI